MNTPTRTSANSRFSASDLLDLVQRLLDLKPEERRRHLERLHEVLSPLLKSPADLSLFFLGNSAERDACAEALGLMAQLAGEIWSDQIELQYWECAYEISPLRVAPLLRPAELVLVTRRSDPFALRILSHVLMTSDDLAFRGRVEGYLESLLRSGCGQSLGLEKILMLARSLPPHSSILKMLLAWLGESAPANRILEWVGIDKLARYSEEPLYSQVLTLCFDECPEKAVRVAGDRLPAAASPKLYVALAPHLLRQRQFDRASECYAALFASPAADVEQRSWAASQYLLIHLSHGSRVDQGLIESMLASPHASLPYINYARGCLMEHRGLNREALARYKAAAVAKPKSECERHYAAAAALRGYLLATRLEAYSFALHLARLAEKLGRPLPPLQQLLARIRADWRRHGNAKATPNLIEKVTSQPQSPLRSYVLALVRLIMCQDDELEAIDLLAGLAEAPETPSEVSATIKSYCLDCINAKRGHEQLPNPAPVVLIPWLPPGSLTELPPEVWQEPAED